jgi:uncharacterized repeat protein (TIGR03803 family)
MAVSYTSVQVQGGVLRAVASFDVTNNGNQPLGVTFDAFGNMYGVAENGGANSDGTVWEIKAGSQTLTTLATFNGTNGPRPSGLVLDAQGNLFGASAGGGPFNQGTVWEIKAGSNTITMLGSFSGGNGGYPNSGMTLGPNGQVLGTTSAGPGFNGVVWSYTSAGGLNALAFFSDTNARRPLAGVTIDAHGNLYGTTAGGGPTGDGTVWMVKAGTSTITTLASFNGTNGSAPEGRVTVDAQGNIYGTAIAGGASGNGTVWMIAKGGSTINALASFDGDNGGGPTAGVTLDVHGNLYGTAIEGGSNNDGTLWELEAGSNVITALASFSASTGTSPNSDVIFDANGNLYGTTESGGAVGGGTVWQFQTNAVPEPSSLMLVLIGIAITGGTWARIYQPHG